jgi:hypothetical protein
MTDAPADDDAAFHQIYDDLVRKHNLSSPAYLAIARSLAALLLDDTGDPVTSARAIGKLTDLLPDAPLKPVLNCWTADRCAMKTVQSDHGTSKTIWASKP